MPKIKEIAFDFDGVLSDSTHHSAKEIGIVGFALTGRFIASELLFERWGVTFEDFLGIYYPEITFEEYLGKRSELGFDRVFPPRIKGVRKTIEILSRKYPLSIITNRERRTLDELLEMQEINQEKFRFIQSCSETDFHKPDGRVFEKLFDTADSRLNKGELLYVGDLLVDHQAACNAGVMFAGVLTGGVTTRENFLGAGVPEEMIFKSINDLPGYLGLD